MQKKSAIGFVVPIAGFCYCFGVVNHLKITKFWAIVFNNGICLIEQTYRCAKMRKQYYYK